MNPDTLFQAANTLAMLSWVALIIFQSKSWIKPFIVGISISLLAVIYVYLVVTTFDPGVLDSFSTLAGVRMLFQNEAAVLAGWIHYLAFDLMTGLYIVASAEKLGINRWVILPSLLLTFMFGPLGLLSYFIIRFVRIRSYFQY